MSYFFYRFFLKFNFLLIISGLFLNSPNFLSAEEVVNSSSESSEKSSAFKNIVIPIRGEIEPSLIKYLKRTIAEAESSNPTNIIFEINTFGGRIDTTYEIVDLITAISFPTIAVIDQKAISAGTLIAMASQKIYMKANSTLGDVAPIMMGQNGPQVLGEKFQSPLRAKFRTLAQKNGYPVKLSEAFVTDSIEILEITWNNGEKEILTGTEYDDLNANELNKIQKKRTIVRKGELLTMSDKEAYELQFSQKTINDLKEAVENDGEIVYLEKQNSEKALTYMVRYGWVLLLLGLGGIYLEVRNPGFGFYGIAAIIAFILFFSGNYLVELANYVELVLLILGIVLLFLEIFVLPGFGILGVGGFVLLFISSLLMMQNFTIPDNFIELATLIDNFNQILYVFLGSGVLFLVTFLTLPRILRKSPLVFSEKLDHQDVSNQQEVEREIELHQLLEKTGITHTSLRPSGTIIIDEKYYDALTHGDFVDQGKKIRVIEVRGSAIFVEEIFE